MMRTSLEIVLTRLKSIIPESATSLSVEEMIRIRDDIEMRPESTGLSLLEIRQKGFEESLEFIGHSDQSLAKTLFDLYIAHRFDGFELYDDVLPVLHRLEGRYRLGVITNGNSHAERGDLQGRFAFTVRAATYNILKPHPEIFQIAARQAGCKTEEMLHVGDSLQFDVAGAQSAGICSVWLNRDGNINDTDVIPGYEIHTLSELVEGLAV